MAINFTRLFTAYGKICGALNEWNVSRGATLTARVATLRTQLIAIGSNLPNDLTTQSLAANQAGASWVSYLSQLCAALLQQEVLNDRPFADTSFEGLLAELQRQMLVGGQTLAASYCTPTTAAIGSPTGTPAIAASDTDYRTGTRSNWLLPDVLLLEAQSDTTFNITGNAAPLQGDTDPLWPLGAGLVSSLTVQDPSSSTLGSDPGFSLWTSGTTPTVWTVTGGTATKASDDAYGAASGFCASLTGTASSLQKLSQSTGVSANGVYAVCVFLKKTASPANTGTVVLAIEDASGNVISSVSFNVSALTGAWLPYTGYLAVVPTVTASPLYLSVRFTGGTGDIVRIDNASILSASPLYANGMLLTIWKGVTATVAGDAWTVTTVVDSSTLPARLYRGLNRLLPLGASVTQLPTTTGAATQLDTLVS